MTEHASCSSSLLPSSDPSLIPLIGRTHPEASLDGKGSQAVHPVGIGLPGHTASQRRMEEVGRRTDGEWAAQEGSFLKG